jgi:DNA-binding Lrp family transcriptional regulator
MFTAARVDVNLIDRTLLKELSSRADTNHRVPLTLKALSKILECHPNTVFNSVGRLESSGYIKRLSGRGRGGQIYEVICQPIAKQSSS